MLIRLGRALSGQEVTLSDDQLLRHLYIVGLSGTGKSKLLANLILQVISSSEPRNGAVVIDPAGSLADDVLRRIPKHRVNDVIYLNPLDRAFPFSLNPFALENVDDHEWRGSGAALDDEQGGDFDATRAVLANEILNVLRLTLPDIDEQIEAALRNVIQTLLSWDPGEKLMGDEFWPGLDEIPPFLLLETTDDENKPYFKQRITTYRETVWYPRLIANQLLTVLQYMFSMDRLTLNPKGRLYASILNKLAPILSNPLVRNIVAQRDCIDFTSVVREGKIVIVSLPQHALGDTSSVLAGLILAKVLVAINSQRDKAQSERSRFYIFGDEGQDYFSESLMNVYRMGRQFGATVVLAQTDRGSLKPWQKGALDNAQNILLLNLSAPDADEMASRFDSTPPSPEPEYNAVFTPYRADRMPRDGHLTATLGPEQLVRELDDLVNRASLLVRGLERWANPQPLAGDDEALVLRILDEYHQWVQEVRRGLEGWDEADNADFVGLWATSARRDPLIVKWARENQRASLSELSDLRLHRSQGRMDVVREYLARHRPPALIVQSARDALVEAQGFYDRHVYYVQEPAWEDSYGHLIGNGFNNFRDRSEMSYVERTAISRGPTLYRKTAGRTRSYADVRQEIANALCHQPDRQVMGKLAGLKCPPIELVFTTADLPHENATWPADVKNIVEQTRSRYCRPVAEVKRQLQKRDDARRKALEQAAAAAREEVTLQLYEEGSASDDGASSLTDVRESKNGARL